MKHTTFEPADHTTNPNAAMGAGLPADPDMQGLITMIRAFDHAHAKPDDNMALAQALKVVADDVLTRHAYADKLQQELSLKLSTIRITEELAGVIGLLRPPKKRWWQLH